MVDNGRMTHDRLNPPVSWPQIFALWGDLPEWELCKRIAQDFGISDPRIVRLWVRREAMPMERWERLITLLRRNWGLVVLEGQLVQATLASRCRKREAA